MADLALIKKLREATGCGISDCNKALAECKDDFDASVDWLRKKGLSAAVKKGARVTSEGVVCVNIEGSRAVILELNSETDFVARNEKFQNFAKDLSDAAVKFDGDIDGFKAEKFAGSTVEEEIKNQIGVIGENINLRRLAYLKAENGAIVSYVHNSVAENMGKIGVLVAFNSKADKSKLQDLGKQIAMHIAATKPEALNIDQVDEQKLNRETEVLKDQARASGKPENIIEKMIEGRIRKYYEEIVLNEQFFVMDDKKKIKEIVADFAKENGETEISDYKLFILGDGVEKKENDFAAEVASMTK